MYKVGQWLCALSDLELGVHLGSAEHGRWVAGDLQGTLDIDPNPNGILLLHQFMTGPNWFSSVTIFSTLFDDHDWSPFKISMTVTDNFIMTSHILV